MATGRKCFYWEIVTLHFWNRLDVNVFNAVVLIHYKKTTFVFAVSLFLSLFVYFPPLSWPFCPLYRIWHCCRSRRLPASLQSCCGVQIIHSKFFCTSDVSNHVQVYLEKENTPLFSHTFSISSPLESLYSASKCTSCRLWTWSTLRLALRDNPSWSHHMDLRSSWIIRNFLLLITLKVSSLCV